jgi:hypothetical protein
LSACGCRLIIASVGRLDLPESGVSSLQGVRPAAQEATAWKAAIAGDFWLDGSNAYRLRVPPNPPIELFWSVTHYDVDTRALIKNKQKIAARSPRMDLRRNNDGSVDIHCGPKAPAYFDRSWPLPDFEEIQIGR